MDWIRISDDLAIFRIRYSEKPGTQHLSTITVGKLWTAQVSSLSEHDHFLPSAQDELHELAAMARNSSMAS